MFEKIKRLLGKPTIPEAPETPDTGAISGIIPHLPMLGLSGFGLRNGSYDNTYPSISRIADAIAEVQPIAIGADGKEKQNAHLLEVLNRPNKEMCSTDFMEALAVMLLVHPKIHLLVWRRDANGELVAGGNITEQNIAGLTFMEGVSERIVGGKSEYGINGKIFTEDEVLTLSLAVNPYHLADGYSPSVAAKKWATTDDYIAEYHNAQFRNNARPAGMLTIVADSVDEFNDAVDTIEAKFRGASNAGNTIYNMRPSQTLDGKPAPAKIEWTPFAQTNKDLTLEPVYNQANRKLESVFGVPEEVRGHLQNSNYASAEVADYIFSRRVVYPTLVKIYSKLTHELNRVTGGLGYALSFHYEVPMLTDTRKLQAEALKTMMDAGFTVETSVEALRLPESYKVLQLAPKTDMKKDLAPTKVVRATRPTTSKIEDTEPLPKEDLVSPNLLIAYDDLTHTVLADIEDGITGMVATYEEDGELDVERKLDLLEDKLERAYRSSPNIDKNIVAIKTDLDHLRVSTIAKQAQALSAELGVEVETGSIGLEIKKRIAEVVADDLYDSYRTTVKNLLNHTAEIIYRTIANDDQIVDELENQIIDELERLGEKQHWRAVRFGFTEQQIVMSITAEMLWVWAQSEYQFKGYKAWHISPLSPAPCEDCIKTNGETVRIGEKFSNGVMYPPLHPNCYCYCEYSTGRTEEDKGVGCGASELSRKASGKTAIGLDRAAQTVKVRSADDATDEAPRDARRVRAWRSASDTNIKITCPKCGRFLMDASEAKIQKMICPNTKCKARLAIDTIEGATTIVSEIENE